MTFQAFQVDVLGVNELIRNGSVGVVAIPALDLLLPYGMAGSSEQLRSYGLVTLDTHFDFGGF
jgi:hypothetical protein